MKKPAALWAAGFKVLLNLELAVCQHVIRSCGEHQCRNP